MSKIERSRIRRRIKTEFFHRQAFILLPVDEMP